jgi:hypothetical protein
LVSASVNEYPRHDRSVVPGFFDRLIARALDRMRVSNSPQEEVEYMNTMPRCQDCGELIKVDKMVGGRRGLSIRFCEQCTARYDKAEAAAKRRTIISAIAAVIAITALLVFFLARG